MDFAIIDLMDEQKCYDALLGLLHPGGLCCPCCGRFDRMIIHRRNRDPVLDYRCGHCGRVFNAFTDTVLAGTHRRPSQVMLFLRGIAKGQSTASLSRELKCSRGHLLELRHQFQASARATLDRSRLDDLVVEADEMYQNAGEKRRQTLQPRRSAAATRQFGQRTRHVEVGSPAGGWRGGSRQRHDPPVDHAS